MKGSFYKATVPYKELENRFWWPRGLKLAAPPSSAFSPDLSRQPEVPLSIMQRGPTLVKARDGVTLKFVRVDNSSEGLFHVAAGIQNVFLEKIYRKNFLNYEFLECLFLAQSIITPLVKTPADRN